MGPQARWVRLLLFRQLQPEGSGWGGQDERRNRRGRAAALLSFSTGSDGQRAGPSPGRSCGGGLLHLQISMAEGMGREAICGAEAKPERSLLSAC